MAGTERAVLFQQIERLYRDGSAAGLDDAQLLARFVRDRDEGAFEALVQRHGPLVLGLCRRFLRDPRDIEDAFQATFLVLALAGELDPQRLEPVELAYGVAHRVASRCRSDVLRRRAIETTVDGIEFPVDGAACLADELGPVLDQELNRLPEKYRAPIVLCYLREQTHDQAAAELKWPVGTVRSRLARGRELLRGRLTRRGWAPADAALGLAPLLTPRSFSAPVPPALVEATVASAGRFLGGTAAGLVPAAATLTSNLTGLAPTLARGVLSTMAITQYTWIGSGLAAMALVAGGAGAGAWALSARGDGGPDDKPGVKAQEKPSVATDVPTFRNVGVSTPEATPSDVSARLSELERKLDLLLGRLQIPPVDAPTRLATPVPEATTILPPGGVTTLPTPTPRAQASPVPSIAPAPAIASSPVPGTDLDGPVARPTPAIASSPAPQVATLPPPRPEPALSPDGPTPALAVAHDDPINQPQLAGEPSPPRRALPARSTPMADEDHELSPSPVPLDDPLPARRAVPPRFREHRRIPEDEVFAPPPRPEPPLRQAETQDPFSTTPMSLREIEARIQIARRKLERNRSLLKAAAISQSEAQEPIDGLLLLQAQLEATKEAIDEQLGQVVFDRSRAELELKRARAEHSRAMTIVARNARLNERQSGVVDQHETARAVAEQEAADANVEVKALALKEVQRRHETLLSRKERIDQVLGRLKDLPELGDSSQARSH